MTKAQEREQQAEQRRIAKESRREENRKAYSEAYEHERVELAKFRVELKERHQRELVELEERYQKELDARIELYHENLRQFTADRTKANAERNRAVREAARAAIGY